MSNHNKNKSMPSAAPAGPAEQKAPEVQSVAVQKKEPRKVGITDTSLRDGHQSLMATRMSIEDMTPIVEMMDDVGFHSMEVWGGATFDSCMRFLDEDPWERLRTLRKLFKKTKLQMLLRGQNVVGYRHYADDTVREFVKRAVGNGLDIIRVFDALNDLRNMEVAADQIKKEGAHLQLAFSFTLSPVHSLDAFAKLSRDMKSMGADSICIKDMAGIISPVETAALVRTIKKETGLPVQIHSHYTSGMASMAYFAGLEAGADVVDCAISPFAQGTSQPPIESMVAGMQGGEFETGIDLKKLVPIATHFKKVREKYSKIFIDLGGVDINVLMYQIPGGMYSNLVSQLKDQNALHRLPDVLNEVPRVRKEMGYPPLVTPTSQIVGTQATLNVLVGERWKIVPKEVRSYFLGQYGKPPAELDPEIQKKVIGDETPITCRPAENIAPELDAAAKAIEPWILQPEDVLSYVLFPAVAKDFLMRKFAREMKVDVGVAELVDGAGYPV
ncbi:pyruvate carboxylase subunit B [Aminivibrio sp.]|jgi:oxaloacetate decarboxylase alpha subunit|uniref:pyruvate carboxylase subunit B n=1 Tax=Aminivibrio sp. TaxID=1872489 RepID=UPI00356DD3AE|nr:pyruvate carboxylase subunit B [Synergistaceae bacterium]MDD4612094.1 pyruvate carboxylase subunit B [Synergistaceae bacterium]